MSLRTLDDVPSGSLLKTTIAIVGAGPAGITLGLELERRGIDIVLLEAGGLWLDPSTQQRYAGDLTVSDGFEYPPLEAWRLRMLGGTSNHWGGWCRRLEPNVFEPRPWLEGALWPFAQEDLEEHYRHAHELCELGRDLYDAEAIQADLGLAVWPGLEASGLESSIWRYSPPTRFGERYGGDLRAGAIDLILGANVVELDTEADSVRRLTVVAEGDRGARWVEADIVVIACGGLESVRHLLLLEASRQKALDGGGWLGRGFMEHPHGVVGEIAVAASLALDDEGPLAIFRQRVRDVDGVDVRAGLTVAPDVCADRLLPNMSFTIDPAVAGDEVLQSLPHGSGVKELIRVLSAGEDAVPHRIYMRSEQRLQRNSRISLSSATDDLGLRRLRLDWRVAPQDLIDAATGVEMIASAFASLGVALVHSSGAGASIRGITGGAHHLGGARMHDEPSEGVVDADLRVHGMRNLYVCSSATFPAGGYANPTLTVVALAHRLAVTLAGET